MAHWCDVLDIPILEMRYEQLVGDLEMQTRRLVKFLDLEWDDRCLDFHNADRVTATSKLGSGSATRA